MTKWLFLPLLTLAPLQAKAINPDDLYDIYIEAILFVAIFALMSVISIVISRRHAKEYAQSNPVLKPDIPNKSAETTETDALSGTNETDRLVELSKMLKEGVLTEEEFQLLKQKLK